ncbi:signal peptidase I [Vagococcus sp. BWB3-3]|uniref:Signal peptidase I n=1 Tax=Vagococcus allomyrinae TaxID=2794353 RepID=A0A940SVA3_9ENTE|nr:signal peptidase I [Vagococcus allomyrinae]
MFTIVKGGFNLFYYIIVITLIASATLFALNRDSNKSYFGYRFYTVLTDSMVAKKDSPPGGFRSGDMIVVQSIEGKQAQVGDIVTFLVGDSGDKFLTHRVVEKMSELNGEEGDFLVTRGDANNADDPPIASERVVGKKVFTIPNVGFIADFVRANLWICLTFVLGLIGFLLVLRYYLFEDRSKDYR